ncbi:hypothetical protein L479_02589 [Exiguobacterium sp. S17]|nr:hypothetical protein L479_02589 [Exiguobacterium sp. S17]
MKSKRKPKWVYRLRRALLLVPAIAFTAYVWPNDPPKQKDKTEQTSQHEATYTIEASKPIHEDDAVRYEYDVVVHGRPDVETLQSISHDVMREVIEQDTFQAALIRFYDYEAYIGTDSPLGQAVYAPGGDWSLAETVEAGDYDDMVFGWQLREKEWTGQLSEGEVRVWEEWNKIYEAKQSNDPDLKAKVTRTISTKYDLEPEKVQHIVMKQSVWAAL